MAEKPSITDRLGAAFRRSGLTQSDLARRVGITRASVHAWLHGRAVNIRPEHLFAVADVLDVEARWLATGEGPMDRQRLSLKQRRLIDDWHSLNEEQRRAVSTVMASIAETGEKYKT